MYSNGGTALKRQLEEILALDCENDKKKEKVFSSLRFNALEMKKHFRECLKNDELGRPIEVFGSGAVE